jgi:hypothetical protein
MQPFDAALTDLFDVQEFLYHVADGTFVDADGQGFYGTPGHYDLEAPARPSEIIRGHVKNNGYGYVHWFNK